MINYNLLALASHFYSEEGFVNIEVPWLVSEAVSDITRPWFAKQYGVTKGDKKKALIASGEQGFLYLRTKGHLPDGAYQTITPCFRNDDFDETHTKYFMKLELIDVGRRGVLDAVNDVDAMVESAVKFFKIYCETTKLNVVTTDIGYDVEYHGIEIGSYGYRECGLGPWIYGTGIAEPRFSRLLKAHDRIVV